MRAVRKKIKQVDTIDNILANSTVIGKYPATATTTTTGSTTSILVEVGSVLVQRELEF